jgi:uncharacterized protein YecE (DUF72 family)
VLYSWQRRGRGVHGGLAMVRRYWTGTSGWVYAHWSGVFYPPGLRQKDWFVHYSRRFETVEINNTFYHLPKESAWRKWREQRPEGFRYAVKGSRFITHVKRLRGVEEPTETFLSRARLLGDGLGPVLWQLPPQMKVNLDRLREFLSLLPRDVRHVFEFRHESWFEEEVFFTLRMFNVGFCAYHMVDWETPLEVTTDIAYVRFHGSDALYGGNYSDEQLAGWARRLRDLPEDVSEVYCYFNNDACGYAIENAKTLEAKLAAA